MRLLVLMTQLACSGFRVDIFESACVAIPVWSALFSDCKTWVESICETSLLTFLCSHNWGPHLTVEVYRYVQLGQIGRWMLWLFNFSNKESVWWDPKMSNMVQLLSGWFDLMGVLLGFCLHRTRYQSIIRKLYDTHCIER